MPTTDVNETTYQVADTLLIDPSLFVYTGSSGPLGVGSGADASQLDATTMRQYLQTVDWTNTVNGTTTTGLLSDQTLGGLLGLDPDETWNDYLSNMMFGGTLFHEGTSTWGSQEIGDMLQSWLPGDSTLTIDGDTSITDLLEAFGLLSW